MSGLEHLLAEGNPALDEYLLTNGADAVRLLIDMAGTLDALRNPDGIVMAGDLTGRRLTNAEVVAPLLARFAALNEKAGTA